MTNTKLDKELVASIQKALDDAKKLGATAAETALSVESGLSVTVRMGEIETLEYNHDRGLGITVYFGHRKGSASTSDLSDAAIVSTVRAACDIAKFTAADEYSGIAEKAALAWNYPDLDLCHPWNITSEQAVDLALACETTAREFDARIVNSEGATLSSHEGIHVYGNSHGFIGGYPTSRHSLSCAVISQDGGAMQRDYWYDSARNSAKMDKAEAIGKRAAERAVARLNGRRLSTCQVPVLYVPEVASGLIGHFTRAIRGGSLYRKTSFLLDSLNTQVFPTWMQINEDPHIMGALGSAPFDSEGVATSKRDLVKDGVLLGYVLDTYSARRLNMQTTGNAGGVHNLTVKDTGQSFEQLLGMMDKGLVVTELMGQGINGVTGDYSRGAAGFWVENGKIAYPVEEITVAGNLKQMYQSIVAVGNDVDKKRNIRTGSMLIEKMTIAGE